MYVIVFAYRCNCSRTCTDSDEEEEEGNPETITHTYNNEGERGRGGKNEGGRGYLLFVNDVLLASYSGVTVTGVLIWCEYAKSYPPHCLQILITQSTAIGAIASTTATAAGNGRSCDEAFRLTVAIATAATPTHPQCSGRSSRSPSKKRRLLTTTTTSSSRYKRCRTSPKQR